MMVAWVRLVMPYPLMVKPMGFVDGLNVECERKTSRMTARCLAWATECLECSVTENGKTMGRTDLISFWQTESVRITNSVKLGIPSIHQSEDVQKEHLSVWIRNNGWGPGWTYVNTFWSHWRMIFKTLKLDEIIAIIANISRAVQASSISHLDFFINFPVVSLIPLPFYYYPFSMLLLEGFFFLDLHTNQIRSPLCLISSRGFPSCQIS